MMRTVTAILFCLGLSFFGACGKKTTTPPTGPQASVLLNDGTSFAGTVTASSTRSITVVAPGGETRTYPMSQVSSVQYNAPRTGANPAPSVSQLPSNQAPLDQAPLDQAPASAPSASVAPAPAPATPAPAPAPPKPKEEVRVVPAGSSVSVRTIDTIDSKVATDGQTYSATIARAVVDRNARVVIPRGAAATLVVRSAAKQGKVEGQSELALGLESVRIAGRRYRVETTPVVEKGHEGLGANKRTGVFLGGGAVLGTLLGAVAGGGKGAAIGAVSGAAAGGVTQTATRGKGVRVAAETVLTFRLEAPIRVTEIR